jgi:hypothetical protein
VFGGDAEKDAGGAGGLAAALFPIAQGGGADAEGGGKRRLAEVKLGPDGCHRLRVDAINATGSFFVSAQVGTGFAHTLEKILKIGVFHGNSVLMRSARIWSCLRSRSSCSFLA